MALPDPRHDSTDPAQSDDPQGPQGAEEPMQSWQPTLGWKGKLVAWVVLLFILASVALLVVVLVFNLRGTP